MDKELYDKTDIELSETPEKVANTRQHLQNALNEINKAMDSVVLVTPYYKQTKQWQELHDQCQLISKLIQESIDTDILKA